MRSEEIIRASVTFLSHDDGGRVQLPDFTLSESPYMPHVVVQSLAVRAAKVVDGNFVDEDYLPVRFVTGPDNFRAGQAIECDLELMYHPKLGYEDLKVGATFTIREGAKIVGFGTVLERTNNPESV